MRSRSIRYLAAALPLVVAAWMGPAGVHAATAPTINDAVYDMKRDVIYMSYDNEVLRYDVTAGAYLDPIVVAGGPLKGMDLSPDGHTLAVADADTVAVKVHLIDLDTHVDTVMSAVNSFYEGGSFQVAFTREGNLLVSSVFLGSGWVPLRKLDISSGMFTTLASVRLDSALSTSGDGMVVGFAEPDSSDGPWGSYNALTGAMTHFAFFGGTNTFNNGIATNFDGTKFTLNGGSVYDPAGHGLITIHDGGHYAVASANDPVRPIGYFGMSGTSQVLSYDMNTYMPLASYDIGETFWRNMPFHVSRDGSLLVVVFPDSVRYLRLYDPLCADDLTASAAGRRVQIPLQGHIGNGSALTYGIQTPPAHGKVFVDGDKATYVPAPGYSGQDSFTYAAHYGLAVAEATVTVDVTADDSAYAPTVSFGTLPVLQATTPVPGSARVPGDFNGDGVSDMVWFNPVDSTLGYWTMVASTSATAPVRRTGAKTYPITPGYLVGAVGDFNGDGYADLLFTSGARDMWMWTNNHAGGWRSSQFGSYPDAWQLVGAGDVDGDGKDDLLWLDPSDCKFAYWLMNGSVRKGAKTIDIACGYYPVGVGYYTPTNRLSILWSSAANDLYVWDARGTGFRSYNLTGALRVGDYPTGLAGSWALGGGIAGSGMGLEWNAQDQRFGVGASLTRSFDAQGNQTGYKTRLMWTGGLWMDDPRAAGYLIRGGSSPATGLYALDVKASVVQTGGLSSTNTSTTGNAPRTLRTQWAYPAGWYPVGAPGNPGTVLPWR